MYRSAVDLYLDEWVHDRLELIDPHEARRVFIDGSSSSAGTSKCSSLANPSLAPSRQFDTARNTGTAGGAA
jgi:hypothetical protein